MAAKDERAQYEFRQKRNETLIKEEDDLNGASFSVSDLNDCSVFLLGFTQQVQVDDCDGCRIFIGPCDGSVFIRDCTDCVVSVAARQLRLRDCRNIELGVYCPTQPAVESSKSINFTPWMGAYPGLTRHFSAANLDPTTNSWDRVYDFTPVNDGEAPNWTVQIDSNMFTPQWWEVDVVEGIPDNPVPLPDGQVYQYHGPKNNDATIDGTTAARKLEIDDLQGDEITLPPTPEFQLRNPIFDTLTDSPQSQASGRTNPLFLGTQTLSPEQDSNKTTGEDETVLDPKPYRLGDAPFAPSTSPRNLTPIAVWRQENQERLEAKQQNEVHAKAKIQEAAMEFRRTFDQDRTRMIEGAKKTNREEQLLVETKSKQNPGLNPWDGVVNLIDFDLHTHTIDVSRFKSLLFAAKSQAAPAWC